MIADSKSTGLVSIRAQAIIKNNSVLFLCPYMNGNVSKLTLQLLVLQKIRFELNDGVLPFDDGKAIEYLQTKKGSIRLPAGA